jgi:hypothetical protein
LKCETNVMYTREDDSGSLNAGNMSNLCQLWKVQGVR